MSGLTTPFAFGEIMALTFNAFSTVDNGNILHFYKKRFKQFPFREGLKEIQRRSVHVAVRRKSS
jgi:hypothetical protein